MFIIKNSRCNHIRASFLAVVKLNICLITVDIRVGECYEYLEIDEE